MSNKKNISLPVSKLFKDKSLSINELCQKASLIQKVEQKLKKCLDPSLHDYFELANIKTDSVVILVNSPTWATRLRYNIPAILDALNNQLNFTTIKTVRIKVKTLIPEPSAKTENKICLSESSAQILRNVADNFNDSELRECFIKLSKNVNKSR